MEQNNHERCDYCDKAQDITKKVHVEVLDFDGRIDPQVFLDLPTSLERYFDQYDMFDKRRVRIAVMKLIGKGQI